MEANNPLADIQWSTKNCVLRDPANKRHLYASLGTVPYQDDGVNLLGAAIEEIGKGTGVIEFVALPSAGYKTYLEGLRHPKDTIWNRRKYLLSSPTEVLEREWEQSGRWKTDITATVLFSINPPANIEAQKEFVTQYRLTKKACQAITDILAGSYDDGCQLFVSREVIHWGDYLQDPQRFYWDGVTVLDGGARGYMGADLEQCFGCPMDARFMAPLLCLPVVLRRTLPRKISKDDGEKYLDDCIPLFKPEQLQVIFKQLNQSGIFPATVFNRLIPDGLMIYELNKIFAEKGCAFSV